MQQQNAKSIWNKCLTVIKDNIETQSFNTWFEPIKPIKYLNNVLTVQVPSQFFYEWLEEHYLDLLKKTIKKELGKEGRLEYNIVMDYNPLDESKPYTINIPGNSTNKITNSNVSIPLSSNSSQIRNPFIIPGIKKINIDPQLNSSYSFDNLIEGECNRLARSAGLAIAKNPGGTSFNPLFIYGSNGLGKTHLSHAIGIETKNNHPDKTVLYVSAQKFKDQFIDASMNNNRNDFIHFYEMIDVLIIDDVHDFAAQNKTQDIFFHIFNRLHQSGKQIILTADKPPIELEGLEQRLLSRFKWGLSADLTIPDYETRISILKKKAYKDGINVPNDVIEYLAYNIATNIRELESALISILAQSSLNKKEITLDLARQIVDNFIKNTEREVSIDYIQKVVCDYFNLNVDQLKSKTRKREIVQARQIAMFFAKKYTKASLATIGSQIGKKDHATVLHACRTVNNLRDTDKRFKGYLEEVEKKIRL